MMSESTSSKGPKVCLKVGAQITNLPKFKRDKDGFFTCPNCGAPSLNLRDAAAHFIMMHNREQPKR